VVPSLLLLLLLLLRATEKLLRQGRRDRQAGG
jgi:hypothetical protein